MIDGKGCAIFAGLAVAACFALYAMVNTVVGWFA